MNDQDINKSKVPVLRVKSLHSTKSVGELFRKSLSRIKMRKTSYGFASVTGARADRVAQPDFKRPALMYLNTYQLDPRIRFHVPKVKHIINVVLDEKFTNHKYTVQVIGMATSLNLAGCGYAMARISGVSTF